MGPRRDAHFNCRMHETRTEVPMSATGSLIRSTITSRRFWLCSIAVASLSLTAPLPALAQDTSAPPIENSKYQATGAINNSQVYVRSGASDTDYPVMRLDKGAPVTVVGMRFDWLKIVPPEGSY